jgi:hypothetical protein
MITTAKFEKTSATVKKIVDWAISSLAPKKFGEGSTTNHKAYRMVPKPEWTRVRGCLTSVGLDTMMVQEGNMPRRIVPEVSKEEVRNAYKIGGSLEGAAGILGVSKKCVLNWMKKFDLPRRQDIDPNAVLEMAKTMTNKEIAEFFGVTKGHITELAKSLGFKFLDSYHPGYATNQSGYLLVRDSGRYKRSHRVIVEESLGRKLNPDEVVHHINGDKKDNRIENLQVMTKSEHSRLHYLVTKPSHHKILA